jgi:hypothetical protein
MDIGTRLRAAPFKLSASEIKMPRILQNHLIAILAVLAPTAILWTSPALAQGKGQGPTSAPVSISFRQGFQVPVGKRLLIDDVSVVCTAVGTTVADFRASGLSASALLQISYPPAKCPEPLDSEGECHQLFAVGTAKQNGLEPIFVTSDGRPAANLWAGRPFNAFADDGATLQGQCDGIEVNFPPDFGFGLRGSGRLIDRP